MPKLEIATGEKVAVIGPSGSGKTTLLHLIAGIHPPEAGRIRTQGVELTGLDDRRRREFRLGHVGLVFQEFELLEYLSVLDNVLLPYRIGSRLRLDAAVRERAMRLATDVGIGDKVQRNARLLSQGERQRVAICRALLAEPGLLLADEPTGNLDPRNKGRVLDILVTQAEEHGSTLLTVTHDHGLLDRFDRVLDLSELAESDGDCR